MLFYYVRHGDPIYNPDSLTPLGSRQAEAVAKRLALYGVDKIFSSTSNRAIMTATPTSKLLKKEIVPLDFANEGHIWSEFTVTKNEKTEWIFQNNESKMLFEDENNGKRGPLGSSAFVPSSAGLMLASHVVSSFLKEE